jgi:hypothetical protein
LKESSARLYAIFFARAETFSGSGVFNAVAPAPLLKTGFRAAMHPSIVSFTIDPSVLPQAVSTVAAAIAHSSTLSGREVDIDRRSMAV